MLTSKMGHISYKSFAENHNGLKTYHFSVIKVPCQAHSQGSSIEPKKSFKVKNKEEKRKEGKNNRKKKKKEGEREEQSVW